MSSAENQHHAFPAIPPSLSAGDHEMRNYYTAQDAPRPTLNQAPYLTPYLGLRARLSQIWINRWTILLFLVLVRTLIAVQSLDDNLDSARKQALSACTSVESMGSAMASMPHYMSQGVNEITASGVEKAVNGLMSMLDMAVQGVGEIVIFIIGMLTNTYLCLITLAVRGSLHVALELVEEVSNFLNKTLDGVGDDIADVAGSLQDKINSVLGLFTSFPGNKQDKPTVDFGKQIDVLRNLQLPSGLQDDLEKLNNSIPTFEEVKNFAEGVIRLPFNEIRKLINETMDTYEFDRSAFPVPQKEQLSFCSESNGINDFFDGLVDIEQVARKVFIGVVVTLAILVCIPMAWREIKRWRLMQQRAQLISKNAFDPMDVVYISSRPYSSTIGIKIANRFRSIRHQTLVRWAVAYATSTPALFVLSLGVAGLFACLCQYILLKSIEKEVPGLSNQVGAFAEKVVFALNNASTSWANGTNTAITNTNLEINDKVFGWVEASTTAVNDTLNAVVGNITTVLEKAFGGTPLEEPVKGIFKCLIELKVQGIQQGLTWVHENAHVNFPLMPADTFSIGAAASIANDSSTDSFLANPGTKAKDEITEAVQSLIRKLSNAIAEEALISTCIILIWFFILLIGIARSGALFYGHDKTRAEGGQAHTIDPATDDRQAQNHDFQLYRGDDTAPPYEYDTPLPVNRAAPYTITPRPFPVFGPQDATQPDSNDEKVGEVGARSVGTSVQRPTQMRASSYGNLGGTTPIDEKSANPFADQRR
ncbi:plasma membrane fusion protein prm1 [Coniosporium tulheliwenetii]|uniref:Plasma membrane fusion protein prm1 n=1 Tax=Coniosporium tulheliwenetii TaxID=3383036 RepID=A0ACC2ZPD0_9PEZI|nr:plasma membrane fusion protein prm1 [Cladosporium sp. JES 115]